MEMEEFGNLSFGETTKFLVGIIGRDAILSLLPDYKKGKFEDKLKRIYKEERVEFLYLATQEEDNPQAYFKLFFDELEKKYNVPKDLYFILSDTVWQLFHACLSFTPYEKYKTDTVKYLFRRQIFHFLDALTNQNSRIQLKKIRKDDLAFFYQRYLIRPMFTMRFFQKLLVILLMEIKANF